MPGRWFLRPSLHLVLVACVFAAHDASAQAHDASAQAAQPTDGIARLLAQVEQALQSGDPQAYMRLVTAEADRDNATVAANSVTSLHPIHVVVREEEREVLNAAKTRLTVDIFVDLGVQARVVTWRVDVRRSVPDPEVWQISDQQFVNSLNGLYKLALNTAKPYAARGVSIEAEDLRLQMNEGSVFLIEAAGLPTGIVAVGKGEVTFSPSPATERGQMRILTGADEMRTPVEAIFVRFGPGEAERHVKGLDRPQADTRDVRRAEEVFREYNGRAFALDLGDLSADTWSLLPQGEDVLIELNTRRFGALTYSHAHDEPEDISLFDRKGRRTIASYGSRQRLAASGPFYDEDTLTDYDVIDYTVNARFAPESGTIDARTRMTLVVRADSVANLMFRLADSLQVRSVTAEGLGRLRALRVRGRNAVVIRLPAVAVRGTAMTLDFDYAGAVTPQALDSEAVQASPPQDRPDLLEEAAPVRAQDSYVYSNRAFWYPQSMVSDYATATVQVTVPERYTVVASGERTTPPAADAALTAALQKAGLRRFVFRATRPVRYLACVITPLVQVASERLRLDDNRSVGDVDGAQASGRSVDVTVQTNPREKAAGRDLASLAADILRFYTSLVGDCPYPSIDLALVETRLPGGHSPAYVSVVNYPLPGFRLSWRDDPAAVEGFREYFVAHELAHQWWGQAVGWKNYHEQWLSEGFAQYFAALYAEHAHGEELFQDILRRWQRWAVEKSAQGPVYLGYRVGHIKGDPRVFRAVVYNKSATVLHMLRRLLGDEQFFAGIRRFYRDFRFRKAGTDDLEHAFEAESHVPLQRFFEKWIYGDTLPRLYAFTRTETTGKGQDLVVRLQQAGDIFDVPLAVTLDYADRPAAEVTVKLDEAQQEFRIPLAGSLRRVDLNRVDAVPFAGLVTSSMPAVARASARPRGVQRP